MLRVATSGPRSFLVADAWRSSRRIFLSNCHCLFTSSFRFSRVFFVSHQFPLKPCPSFSRPVFFPKTRLAVLVRLLNSPFSSLTTQDFDGSLLPSTFNPRCFYGFRLNFIRTYSLRTAEFFLSCPLRVISDASLVGPFAPFRLETRLWFIPAVTRLLDSGSRFVPWKVSFFAPFSGSTPAGPFVPQIAPPTFFFVHIFCSICPFRSQDCFSFLSCFVFTFFPH